MSRVVHAHRTHWSLADHAVHGQALVFVFAAHQVPVPDLVTQGRLARHGLQQTVLGQRAPGRMAVLAARVTVQDLALFAQHRGVRGRLAHAQLALGHDVPQLAVPVDDVPHGTVLGQVVRAVVVEVDGLAARRTGQRVRAGGRGREHQPVHVWRAHVTVGPAVAHHAAVRLAQYGQLVRLRMVQVGRVRLGADRRRGCGRGAAAATASRRVAAVLLRTGRRVQRPLRVHRAVQAHGVVARQQHRVVEKLFARDTVQFVFHGRRDKNSTNGGRSRKNFRRETKPKGAGNRNRTRVPGINAFTLQNLVSSPSGFFSAENQEKRLHTARDTTSTEPANRRTRPSNDTNDKQTLMIEEREAVRGGRSVLFTRRQRTPAADECVQTSSAARRETSRFSRPRAAANR